ncbi:MAG: plasmid pRiA4b ORF-3 family protein [Syntrophobacteraceae bacterium]|jgi:hypothetical protein|nr:plasmid pRiA4b ORF-3 family protein [Syntrophobacteraceae bacterium]
MAWIIPTGKSLTLTPQQEKLLRELEIDQNGPGTILRDFKMLLDFTRKGDVLVTGAQQLPLAPLAALNSRMTHPLKHGLKRCTQKSYPHINGLYLLLRASGLTAVESTGRKLVLKVVPSVLDAFDDLSPTEQYFILLETWLLRGWPDIVLCDSRRGLFPFPRTFQEWSFLFSKIPDGGLGPTDIQLIEQIGRYHLEWHNLALLELFGMVTIVAAPPVEGRRGWNIQSLRRAPLGDALLRLIEGSFFGHYESFPGSDEEGLSMPIGAMRTALISHFPAWNRVIAAPERRYREGAHIFRVSLGHFRGRIALPAASSLDDLAHAILGAVRFSSDHLYLFRYRNGFGALEEVNHPYMEDGPWTHEVLVGDLNVTIGQPMTFLFDFGDEWELGVVLEAIEPDRNIHEPVLLETRGEPPEQYPRSDE